MGEEVKELIPMAARDVMKEALEFYGSIEEITIQSDEQNEGAGETRKQIKRYLKDLDKKRKEIVDPMNKEVKAVNNEFRPVTDSLKNADTKLGAAMGNYYAECERKREEEQRKRDAEAAEKERKAQEKAEKEMQKAEEYREEGREEMAEKAEARAETAIAAAEEVTSDIVENTAKQSGHGMRIDYVATVDDLDSAVAALLAQQMYRDCVEVDLKALEKMQKAAKGKMEIAGISWKKKYTTITRTA